MKKILLFGALMFLFVGCSSGENFNCIIDGKKAAFTLKDGVVTEYAMDEEKKSRAEIDELNGIYLASATNNEEAKQALRDYAEERDGTCE